jgi:hypothetical protein
VFFLAMGLLGVLLIVGTGTFELSEDAVSHDTIFGRFRIRWSEIHSVECGAKGTFVLHGENKRFVLPTMWWSGKDTGKALALLHRKLGRPGLPMYRGNFADNKIHRNVRVRA